MVRWFSQAWRVVGVPILMGVGLGLVGAAMLVGVTTLMGWDWLGSNPH